MHVHAHVVQILVVLKKSEMALLYCFSHFIDDHSHIGYSLEYDNQSNTVFFNLIMSCRVIELLKYGGKI